MKIEDSPDDRVLMDLLSKRIMEAEAQMMQHLHEDLLSGSIPADEEVKAWERRIRIRKLLSPYYWLRSRLSMTWSVWRHGSCLECDRSE